MFHRFRTNQDGYSYPIEIIDNAIVETIISLNHIFVLNGIIYRYKSGVYEADTDGTKTRALISHFIYDELITDQRLRRCYNLFFSKEELRIEDEDINKHPSTWINFQNGMLDVVSMEMHPHSYEYMSINQIPWEWKDEAPEAGSIVDTFLRDLIPDPDDRQMFLMYVGYSLTIDTDMQRFMVISGVAGCGKSVLLRLVRTVIGRKNISGIPLQNLNQRFDPAFLQGKLLNMYADLPSIAMETIHGIKTIVGQDHVRGEIKHGAIFDFHPYCKLLFSANAIPKSRGDRSDAYYRRLLILKVDKRAKEIENLEARLQEHAEDLLYLAVVALHYMYVNHNGQIVISDRSKLAVSNLQYATDTVAAWLMDEHYIPSTTYREDRKELYKNYTKFCDTEERRQGMLSPNGFYDALREKGFREQESHHVRYFYMCKDFEPAPDDFSVD